MDEFDFLKKLMHHFKFDLTGDDCAVLEDRSGQDLLVTTDMLVEGVDFRLEWADAESIGHKSLAVSLSDIAAMGGDASWAFVSLGIPDRLWNEDFLFAFYNGFNSLARQFGVKVAGGDISRNPDRFVVDSIVLGSCPSGRAVMRSGAAAGDIVVVTGSLGAAAGGLRILESDAKMPKIEADEVQELVRRQLKPMPQLYLAKQLQQEMLVTAMIDVSDGLSSDLSHICERSGVGAVIDAARIPVEPELNHMDPATLLPFGSPLEAALNGGEDYELLLTAAPEHRNDLEALGCVVIGEIVSDPSVLELERNDLRQPLASHGYVHFREVS